MMRRKNWGVGWIMALATVGAVVTTTQTSFAAGVRVGGGGIKQFGDPFYFYILEFYLEPGYEFRVADSVTLHLLAGVKTPGSATSSPNGSPDPSGPWAPVITNQGTGNLPNYSPPTTVPFADVTFFNAFNVVSNAGPTEMYLGQFTVLTALSLPELPPNYFTDIFWTAELHVIGDGAYHDSGTVRLGLIVPEPSSLALLVTGTALPLFWAHRRRRAG